MIKVPLVLFKKYGIEKLAAIHKKNGAKEIKVYDQTSDWEEIYSLQTLKPITKT